jgi:hypothetical protein
MHISNLQAPAQCRSTAFADYFAVFFFAAAFFVDLPVARVSAGGLRHAPEERLAR